MPMTLQTVLLGVVAVMILYDLSLHVLGLLQEYGAIGGRKSEVGGVLLTPHPLEPGRLFDYLAQGSAERRRKVYQIFWTLYWITAFLLVIAAVIRG